MHPAGSGGAWASAALAFLDDVPTSRAARSLAPAHAALGTRYILILGQATRALPGGWNEWKIQIAKTMVKRAILAVR
jgi:hypothetical protein